MDPGPYVSGTVSTIIAEATIESIRHGEFSGKRLFSGRPVNNLRKWIDPRKSDVNVDIYSYTGETMYEPICTVLQEKRLISKTVRIRILLRDCDHPFLLRNRDKNPNYELYDEEVAKSVKIGIQKWKDGLESLPDNIRIEIKTYKFEPSFKAVMINGSRGYFGFYRIDPKHVKLIQGSDISAPDYVAADTPLVPLDNPRLGPGLMLLNSFKSWFEITWDKFSEPIKQ